jgi:hypothetical protein
MDYSAHPSIIYVFSAAASCGVYDRMLRNQNSSDKNEEQKNNIEEPDKIEQDQLPQDMRFLFSEFPQFEKDYPFFIAESYSKPPYICETKRGLAWTGGTGCLALYFKSLVPKGKNVPWGLIEKAFRIQGLKGSTKSKTNYEWDEEVLPPLQQYREKITSN